MFPVVKKTWWNIQQQLDARWLPALSDTRGIHSPIGVYCATERVLCPVKGPRLETHLQTGVVQTHTGIFHGKKRLRKPLRKSLALKRPLRKKTQRKSLSARGSLLTKCLLSLNLKLSIQLGATHAAKEVHEIGKELLHFIISPRNQSHYRQVWKFQSPKEKKTTTNNGSI